MSTVVAGDSGEIVTGWLTRLAVGLAVVGVLAYDGLSLGVANLTVTDTAAAAVRAASNEQAMTHSAQAAYERAVTTATEDHLTNEVPVEGFSVAGDETVRLTVRRDVPTLVLHHIPRSEGWLVAEATAVRAAG